MDPWQLVIIGEAPTCGEITFKLGNDDGSDVAGDLGRCGLCGSWFFFGADRLTGAAPAAHMKVTIT